MSFPVNTTLRGKNGIRCGESMRSKDSSHSPREEGAATNPTAHGERDESEVSRSQENTLLEEFV